MKRPIREYLQELPAPYNTLALSVVDEDFKDYEAEVRSLDEAFCRMCNWQKTPQGHDFWYKVYAWCINPKNKKLPPIPAIEVETPISEAIEKANQENQSKPFCGFEFSPEVEQTNNLLEIGKTFNTLSEQLNSLIQENVSLSDGNALYQDKIKDLEQENTQLKAPLTPTGRLHVKNLEQENTELRADKERIVDLLNKAQITIADLESQITALAGLADFEQEPVSNQVYDAEWLAKIILGFYYPEYNYYFDGRVGIKTEPHGVNILLDPKASAGIIMAALAKELNEDTCVTDCYWFLEYYDGKYSIQEADESYSAFGAIRFCNKTVAQQAIGILTQIDPQILKNYFQS